MILDEKQNEAIKLCKDKEKRLVGITGGAGTGKTTIIKKVYEELTQDGFVVAVAAPTGKASKRIQEATGIDATTIHRLLEYPMPKDEDPNVFHKPKRNRNNRLEFDVVICDEYAMVESVS